MPTINICSTYIFREKVTQYFIYICQTLCEIFKRLVHNGPDDTVDQLANFKIRKFDSKTSDTLLDSNDKDVIKEIV